MQPYYLVNTSITGWVSDGPIVQISLRGFFMSLLSLWLHCTIQCFRFFNNSNNKPFIVSSIVERKARAVLHLLTDLCPISTWPCAHVTLVPMWLLSYWTYFPRDCWMVLKQKLLFKLKLRLCSMLDIYFCVILDTIIHFLVS